MNMMYIIWPIVCGLANRIRGGGWASIIIKYIPFWSTTPARIFVSGIISVPVFLTHTWREALAFWVVLFIGFIWGWAPWILMERPLRDTLALTVRGWVLTFPAGIILKLHDFAASGLLMGLVYYLTYRLQLNYTDCTGHKYDASDFGELFFGTILGFFICLSCYLYI